ncbi:hypothetical protein SAMN05192559_105177 [Halobacillus karajensis]|uniref:hypothetical protein n=1 Tax=Halobacillus karajensis TaxID=195088 RepID=UPI0008A741F6|nr:hypothetical protein [Halobacillus karajensis]SEH89821.1 hypothetical protein SAMN05192559_105177 [Halobacillus karajensis]
MDTIFLETPKQGKLNLKADRVVFFEQMQVMEAHDETTCFTLFFYKQQYLTAVKTSRVKIDCYLGRILKEGSHYGAAHPFLQALIKSHTTPSLRKISYPQLKQQMEKNRYSRQEQAKILTVFESFIPKKQLFKDIKSLFYQYRREGNMSGAYQIVRVLQDFAPKNSFVREVGNDLSFKKLESMYLDKSAKLLERDPFFKEECSSMIELRALFEEEGRYLEAVSIVMADLVEHPTQENYIHYTQLIEHYFPSEQQIVMLEHLYELIPAFPPLIEDLFHSYVNQKEVVSLIPLIVNHKGILNEDKLNQMEDLLEASLSDISPTTRLAPLMKILVEERTGRIDTLFEKYVISLMSSTDLEQAIAHLNEFPQTLPIVRKVKRMGEIQEDFDSIQELGISYYELHQLDQALDCFQMEMELKPNDPEPLRWIAKIYGAKQMVHEAKIYQQLCADVQKWA